MSAVKVFCVGINLLLLLVVVMVVLFSFALFICFVGGGGGGAPHNKDRKRWKVLPTAKQASLHGSICCSQGSRLVVSDSYIYLVIQQEMEAHT